MDGVGVSQMELLAWGPTASVTSLARYDAGRDVVSALLETVDFVETAQFVERDGGTYAFTTQERFALDPAVVALLERARVAFLPPVVFEASGVARFEAVGEQSALSSFYEALGSELPTEIEQVEPFRRRPAATGVTDRQRTALTAAVDVGYYEVPRTGGVEAVASRLDCAPSTAGELLRKAERALITSTVESGRDAPQ
jgi:predicted DNA binding protein